MLPIMHHQVGIANSIAIPQGTNQQDGRDQRGHGCLLLVDALRLSLRKGRRAVTGIFIAHCQRIHAAVQGFNFQKRRRVHIVVVVVNGRRVLHDESMFTLENENNDCIAGC